MLKFLRYLNKKDYLLLSVTFLLVILQVYLELEIPGYMNKITQLLLTGGTPIQILEQGGYMLGCALFSLVASVVTCATSTYVATSFSMRIREKQYDQVRKFSSEEMNKFSIYSLITRSTNDVTQIQMILAMGAVIIMRAPVMAIWAIAKISDKSLDWTSTMVACTVAMLAFIAVVLIIVYPRFKKIQWFNDDVNRVTKEGINGLRVIHAHNAEKYQEKKFSKENEKLTETNMSITLSLAFLAPVLTLIMNFMTMFVYFFGAAIIDKTDIAGKAAVYADMITFSSYAMQIMMAILMLVLIIMILPRAMVAFKRVTDVIETKPSIVSGSVTEGKPGSFGEISFKNVAFRYPNGANNVIENVSLDIKKGEMVAFIGSTGSGKSTLVNLVPRFYDVTEGAIEIDGVNIKDYKLDALFDKIGYVPQKTVLFKGTVESNINYGSTRNERTLEDVQKAMAIAQGTDFVENMPDKYNSEIAENGTNISGGQKQRVSIARAVCKKPEIYIFDDTFSALDYKTDRNLRAALKKETGDVTTLVVAQRIGTIMDADKIVVIDDGRIVGIGKHDELMKTCSVYCDIAHSQLSEEELAK